MTGQITEQNIQKASVLWRLLYGFCRPRIIPKMKTGVLKQIIESKAREFKINNSLQSGLLPISINIGPYLQYHFEDVQWDGKSILTLDYGVHVNGYIVEGATSIGYLPDQVALIQVAREATEFGMNLARPNVSVGTIGKKMGELIESVELEGHGDLKGKKLRVNQVIDIFGYRNSQYKMNDGVIIPSISLNKGYVLKEGDIFTIQVATTLGNPDINYTDDFHIQSLDPFGTELDQINELENEGVGQKIKNNIYLPFESTEEDNRLKKWNPMKLTSNESGAVWKITVQVQKSGPAVSLTKHRS